jgi:glycosyltransferase involved in cell wall biosynthesis
MPKPRAVFLTPEMPGLGQGGGALRSQSLLEFLRRQYEVDLITLRVRHHARFAAARAGRNALRLLRGRPPLFDRYSGYEQQIAPQLRPGAYDLAVVEHFWCASYAPLLRPRARRLVLDLHNIESRLARTHAASLRGLAALAWIRFAASYAALEAEWLPRFDTLLVTSEEDRARVSHADVRIFPNDLPELPLPAAAERHAIVFSGNLEYHPNIEAVRWFARSVWPRLRERFPHLEWRVIGRNPHAVEPLLRNVPGARLTGPVGEALAAIAAAAVAVVPLRSGSGTRFKILEAWAAQRAVVSTSIGAEGLGACDGQHLRIADDADAFADAVTCLLEDPAQRAALGAAGRALYLEHFTWPAAWRRLGSLP